MSDKNAQSNNWLDQVTWNEQGLVAVIAQEFDTCDVLMMAWMNRESLQLTLERRGRVLVTFKKKDLAQGRRVWPCADSQEYSLGL